LHNGFPPLIIGKETKAQYIEFLADKDVKESFDLQKKN